MKSLIKDLCTPRISWLFLLLLAVGIEAQQSYAPDPSAMDWFFIGTFAAVLGMGIGVVEHILLTWSSK